MKSIALAAFIAAVALAVPTIAQNYPSWGEQVMAAGKDAGCRIDDWECAVKSGPPLK